MSQTNVIINTRFSATHCWPECPIPEVAFLQNPHRHEFHVQVKLKVEHNDRDVEFINFKNKLDDFIEHRWNRQDLGRMSCEDMMEVIIYEFSGLVNLVYIRIMEDGENGAETFI